MRRVSETTAASRAVPADPVAGSPVYPAGSRVNEAGHLEVGGCDVVEVAREFGTPAYIYVPDDIRARARACVDGLAALGSRRRRPRCSTRARRHL